MPFSIPGINESEFSKLYGRKISEDDYDLCHWFIDTISKGNNSAEFDLFLRALNIQPRGSYYSMGKERYLQWLDDHVLIWNSKKEVEKVLDIPLTDHFLMRESFIEQFLHDERSVDDVINAYHALKGYEAIIHTEYDPRKYERLDKLNGSDDEGIK